MIIILETIEFPSPYLGTSIVHVGKDQHNVLYYGEENSKIQWMKADEYLKRYNISIIDRHSKVRDLILKYQREITINKLLK